MVRTSTEDRFVMACMVGFSETVFVRRIPIVDPDDASALSYYILLVRSPDDLLCIATKPTTDTIEKYSVYINYGKNPTNIDYVAREDTRESNYWAVCFSPQQRPGGQIGKWSYGVRSVLKGKCWIYNCKNIIYYGKEPTAHSLIIERSHI